MNPGRVFQVAPGVLMSEAALDRGIPRAAPGPWHVKPFGDRWMVSTGSRVAQGPSGRTRTFGDELVAQKLADEMNEAGA